MREITSAFEQVTKRLRAIETNERAEVTGAVKVVTFANLPAAGQAGRVMYVSDGRKLGEGAGAGTGCPVYDDSVAWRRYSDDSTVAV